MKRINDWGGYERTQYELILSEKIYPVKMHTNFNISLNDGRAIKCAGCNKNIETNTAGYFTAWIKINSDSDADLYCERECFPNYSNILEINDAKWRTTQIEFNEKYKNSLLHLAIWSSLILNNAYKFNAVRRTISDDEIKEILNDECTSHHGSYGGTISYSFGTPMHVKVSWKDGRSNEQTYKGSQLIQAFKELLEDEQQLSLF